MKIIIDLDGVVVDFVNGACVLHGFENPYNNKENHGVWDLTEILPISLDDFWKGMDHDFWFNLQPMPDAFEIIKVAESFVSDYKDICFLSSPSKNPGSLTGKVAWIEHHLPKYRRRYLLGPQKEFCANSRHILLDDYDHNHNKFLENGGHSFLVPRPWNSHYPLQYQNIPALIESYLKGVIGSCCL